MRIASLILFISVYTFTLSAQTCPSSVTITAANYSVSLTQSNTWIKCSSSIIGTSGVRLDANPSSGFVEMNPGFIANPSSSTGFFVAQALDGCGTSIPARLLNDNLIMLKEPKVFPNPNDGILMIDTGDANFVNVEIFDISNKTVFQNNYNSKIFSIDITNLASALYIVKLIIDESQYIFKIIKH